LGGGNFKYGEKESLPAPREKEEERYHVPLAKGEGGREKNYETSDLQYQSYPLPKKKRRKRLMCMQEEEKERGGGGGAVFALR